jgi:hypothetical protein
VIRIPIAAGFGDPSSLRDGPAPRKTSRFSPVNVPPPKLKSPRISIRPPKSKSRFLTRTLKTGVGLALISIAWPLTVTVSFTVRPVVLIARPMSAFRAKPEPSASVPSVPARPRNTPAIPVPPPDFGSTTNAP